MAESDDRVELTDLDVITRYSLAVRTAAVDRDELIQTLRSDLAWLEGGRRRTASPPVAAEPRRAPARTTAVKKTAVKATVAKKTGAKKTGTRTVGAKKAASGRAARRR